MILLYLVIGFVVLYLLSKFIAGFCDAREKNRDIEDDNRVIEEVLGNFDTQKEKEEIAGLIIKGSSIIKGGSQNGSEI